MPDLRGISGEVLAAWGRLRGAAEDSKVFSSSLCFTEQAGALGFCSRRVLQLGDMGASCGALRVAPYGFAPRAPAWLGGECFLVTCARKEVAFSQ